MLPPAGQEDLQHLDLSAAPEQTLIISQLQEPQLCTWLSSRKKFNFNNKQKQFDVLHEQTLS